jgi:chromate transporter
MDEPSAHLAAEPSPDQVPQVSLATIFWIFFQIGSLSVGGGLTAWLYREIVEKRRLMPEADFMGALTLAQVLPGINMSNLSVYVGQRLRGFQGAIVAMLGLILVPFFAIISMGSIYARFQDEPSVHHFMDGLAATAVALLLAMGIKAIKLTRLQPKQLGLAGLVVVLVGILRLPMVPVILVLAPVSVWLAWTEIGKERADAAGKDQPDA